MDWKSKILGLVDSGKQAYNELQGSMDVADEAQRRKIATLLKMTNPEAPEEELQAKAGSILSNAQAGGQSIGSINNVAGVGKAAIGPLGELETVFAKSTPAGVERAVTSTTGHGNIIQKLSDAAPRVSSEAQKQLDLKIARRRWGLK